MKNNLIAISGKINSGKDTVGKILQIISCFPDMSTSRIIEHLNRELFNSNYEIVKIADTLKNIVCLLLNCTREQLEDREFKEKELGEEWWYWKLELEGGYGTVMLDYITTTKEQLSMYEGLVLVKPTPRLILQLMGTECGREIIHPNIWVNSFFSKYVPNNIRCNNCYWYGEEQDLVRGEDEESVFDGCPICNTDNYLTDIKQSKWIITDMRFPNEFNAVKDKRGITIRVNRPRKLMGNPRLLHTSESQHPSETALDNAKFDIFIDNNGSLSDLVDEIKKLKII